MSADTDLLTGAKTSMQHESAAMLHLFFDYYEDTFPLLRRSAGSCLEHYFERIVPCRIREGLRSFPKQVSRT